MTRYKTRNGVVLTEICGEYAVVAAKELLGTCPYVTQLNESSAFLWRKLENGANTDDLIRAVREEYGNDDDHDEIRRLIDSFLVEIQKLNYLIIETDGEENEKA